MKQLAPILPPNSDARRLAQEGRRAGDGIHHPWMDGMRSQGIKQVTFRFGFTWNEAVTNLDLISIRYSGGYTGQKDIDNPDVLAGLRASGLEAELVKAAAEAVRLSLPARVAPTRLRRVKGTVMHSVVDDECLSAGYDGEEAFEDPDETNLMRAVDQGITETVLQLVTSGADVNARDQLGRTALLRSAARSHGPIVEVLLRHKADVNVKDGNGNTPLINAARSIGLEVVELLLLAGADVDAGDKDGRSAILEAADTSYGGAEVVRLLIEAGADPNSSDHDGRTPLILAADAGNAAIVRELVAAGATLNRGDRWGATALWKAVHGKTEGHRQIVEFLVGAGASVHASPAAQAQPQ